MLLAGTSLITVPSTGHPLPCLCLLPACEIMDFSFLPAASIIFPPSVSASHSLPLKGGVPQDSLPVCSPPPPGSCVRPSEASNLFCLLLILQSHGSSCRRGSRPL